MKTMFLAFAVLFTLISAQPLLDDPGAQASSPAHDAPTHDAKAKTPSWQDEVREILVVSHDTRTALEQEFAAATSETEALEIQLRIQKLEETTELKIMNVQLVHLQQTGRTAEATALAAAIQVMQAPRPVAVPQSRDRSDGQERR